MDIELDYHKLGKRIKEQRLKKHLTQEKLGEIVNVATSNISHIERATTQVSLPSLVKIANALDTTLDWLVCDAEQYKSILTTTNTGRSHPQSPLQSSPDTPMTPSTDPPAGSSYTPSPES